MQTLNEIVSLNQTKLLPPHDPTLTAQFNENSPVLIVLAAGKGTRFGPEPKCIQPIDGLPLTQHTIRAFKTISALPAICVVGYRYQDVAHATGEENIFVCSENPTGGTAFAAYEAFCVSQLLRENPFVVVAMGDRIVPAEIFRQLWHIHCGTSLGAEQPTEADLTLLTAQYDPPRNQGKGRILRDADRRIISIREQRDIEAESDPQVRQEQLNITEGNCPLYMLRARTLHAYLGGLINDNMQGQYYFTDIVGNMARDGALIRSLTTTPADEAYSLLCADVTQPADLPRLERIAKAYYSSSGIQVIDSHRLQH